MFKHHLFTSFLALHWLQAEGDRVQQNTATATGAGGVYIALRSPPCQPHRTIFKGCLTANRLALNRFNVNEKLFAEGIMKVSVWDVIS